MIPGKSILLNNSLTFYIDMYIITLINKLMLFFLVVLKVMAYRIPEALLELVMEGQVEWALPNLVLVHRLATYTSPHTLGAAEEEREVSEEVLLRCL